MRRPQATSPGETIDRNCGAEEKSGGSSTRRWQARLVAAPGEGWQKTSSPGPCRRTGKISLLPPP